MAELSYYTVLEISPDASPAVIAAAYKALAMKYHPDRNGGDPRTVKMMSVINQAYSVLSDPDKRQIHDDELYLRTMANKYKGTDSSDSEAANNETPSSMNQPSTSNSRSDPSCPVDGIIPLMVSQDDLEKRVYSYMASGHWTPDDMLEASILTRKECFYVPAFLFFVEYEVNWTAEFGYDKKVPYTAHRTVTRNNHQHEESYIDYRTETDWERASGECSGEFMVYTYAGERLVASALAPVELVKYAMSQATAQESTIKVKDFKPSFTKGVETEQFGVLEVNAFASLSEEKSSKILDKIKSQGRGDHQRNYSLKSYKESHTTNTIYVPICHAVYDYEGTEYHVWIDGIGGDGIRADKLPEDKGRRKLVYLGLVPLGVGLATLIVSYFSGTFTFDGLVIAAIFGGGYAAIRSWHLIEYSKKIRDSLLTQIHVSSNTIKVTGDEEQGKVARSFQRPEKPFFAKTHYDKFVLPALSVLLLIIINSENTKHSVKTPQTVTLASKSGNVAAPVPIAAPAPTPPVVVKPDTASAVVSVSSVPASAVSSSATAEWVKVGGSKDGEITVYVDLTTIRRTGDKAAMWDMTDNKTAQINTVSGKPYLSHKNQDEFDCNEKKWRLLDVYSFHSGGMGSGEVNHASSTSSSTPGEWSQVTPDSVREDMWKIACGRK